jgi:hypothetical protein
MDDGMVQVQEDDGQAAFHMQQQLELQQEKAAEEKPAEAPGKKFDEVTTKSGQVAFIKEKLATDINWLKRGVLAVYALQTAQEQGAQGTIEQNGVGFSGADGEFLSSVAEQLKKGRPLTAKQLPWVRKKMVKYAGQLAELARARRMH